MKLRAQTVEKLAPTDRRQEIPDDLCTGLYLIVQPSGKKGWQVRYRHSGVHRRMTLGSFPVLSLATARERARAALAAVAAGRDPAEEVRAARAPAPVAEEDPHTVAKLIDVYDKRHLAKLRSGRVVKRELDRHVSAVWGQRNVGTITRKDIVARMDEIADTGLKVTANRVRSYLSGFFQWAVDRSIVDANPVHGIKPVVAEKSRERVLKDDEIRWFWMACEAIGYPWGPMGQMLLLTGQRLGEVSKMSDAEIEGMSWHLPGSRVKNGRAHIVPLSRPVIQLLKGINRIADNDGRVQYIFTTTGETPVSGYFKARASIAQRMEEIAAKERGEKVDIPYWSFHDLRRTCATNMARLGVAVRVTEAVLNHVSGTGAGIVGVYQRHDFADEKRHAMDAWAAHLQTIVDVRAQPVGAGNVVVFRRPQTVR